MQPKEIVEVLEKAQDLFMGAPTNGAGARAQALAWKAVSPTSPDATHFDPLGAVARVCGGYNARYRAVERFLTKHGRTRRGKALRHFFDNPKTKPSDAAQWFGEVIGRAKAMIEVAPQIGGRIDGEPITPPKFIVQDAPEPELPAVGVPA